MAGKRASENAKSRMVFGQTRKLSKNEMADHRSWALWAADCAEHVLTYFEEKCPKDNRPRKAIEAVRAWVRGEITLSEARAAAFAAHAAARDADQAAARAAARAADHAAATAHVAGHARHAATYAVIATGPIAAAKERDWQNRHLRKHHLPVTSSNVKSGKPTAGRRIACPTLAAAGSAGGRGRACPTPTDHCGKIRRLIAAAPISPLPADTRRPSV